MSDETVSMTEADPGSEDTATGYGFVAGIVMALVTIALLVYFLLLTPGSTVPVTTGSASPRSSAPASPAASAWRLVWLG
jgi:hypothetical protein